MRYGDSLSSLSLASSHSGEISLFSLAHGRWRSRSGQPAQAAHPNIRVYGACAVCRCVLVQNYGGIFMRDSGCSLSFSLHPESEFKKTIRPRDE